MIIYPAIDLKDGQCVRLVQGRAEDQTVYSREPAEVARRFEEEGAAYLHVVDLDGAFGGKPANLPAIRAIAAALRIPFQVGGGLRDRESVLTLLECGASRVIIGTRAATEPEFLEDLLAEFGADKIVLGIDAREGMVATRGWVETSSLTALNFGQDMKKLGVQQAICTDVSRDGLLQGPNLQFIREMAEGTGLQIIASGGVSTLENIKKLRALESLGVNGAIVGKALYEGKMDLAEALMTANS
ncbi:MAG TPA: 1-(5-phosphoribosyl)-5-[(5-phosphoribosylamino)methylideneamino]imidazole-4-carboxamide isomerase [Syntrophomonadaceae bacterium]|nr:1-(5-phosphoribosyl)-5-[(5-phosphoribosylamino)methylideneamino]imidazole-4-carboxamide isomerase [Syntrophomonadaceae bacterium]